MNPRAMLRVGLLAAVVASLAIWATRPAVKVPSTAASEVATTTHAKVMVTYFTNNVRCKTCRIIEDLSRRAVHEGFPEEIARGEVHFRVVNFDQDEHRHFVDHYSITNKIVIVSRQNDGKETEWTPRQDVWLHYQEPEQFLSYVRAPIAEYLKGP